MDFLDRLRDLSKKKGIMNNMQLSKASGVPYTTIDGFYRVGYDNAKLSTLRKLAEALDCTLEYLVNGTSEDVEDTLVTEDEMQRLVIPYRTLDDAGKSLVEHVLAYAVSRPAQAEETVAWAKQHVQAAQEPATETENG